MADVSAGPAGSGASRANGGRRVLVVLLATVLLAGCGKTWEVTFDGSAGNLPDDSIARGVLTRDGDDTYEYSYEDSGPVLEVAALPTNTSANTRNAFWPAAVPSTTDGQSCATWTGQTEGPSNIQQGASLRVLTDANGTVLRAVTVTKNIFYGAGWIFNVHVWDTTRADPYILVGQVDLHDVAYFQPYPWHLCAHTVGNVVTMKMWVGSEPEPEWGDARHGGSVTLPPEWVYPGKTGWYIGHLPPGGYAGFANLRTWM